MQKTESLKQNFNGKEMFIALKYRNGIIVKKESSKNKSMAASLSAEMMKLGYIPSEDLFVCLTTLSQDTFEELSKILIRSLRKIKGDDVSYRPFYPNFPKQVMDTNYIELYINALFHYFTFGFWKPDIKKLPRDYAFENIKFQEIDVIDEKVFKGIFNKILSSNESISDDQKNVLRYFIEKYDDLYISDIPYKENLCYVAGIFVEQNKDIDYMVSNATDVLRIATHLSDGDISLASNTKFKSFKRSVRRKLINALNSVIKEEDIVRHKNKWIRLFHTLHVGEYDNEVSRIAFKIRNNGKIETFNSKVEKYIKDKKISELLDLLNTRPSELARRLDKLLRTFTRSKTKICSAFDKVVDDIPTRVLLQVKGHFKRRDKDIESRIIFPKSMTQKGFIINNHMDAINKKYIDLINKSIDNSMIKRFSNLGTLGKVWIDPELVNCPIPTQQRSATSGAFQVARGTHLPISLDKNTLRMFIYWIGQDIDLTAVMYNEQLDYISHISYTRLKDHCINACHSGDITAASQGASEFIDVDINSCLKNNIRYICMNVFVYCGPDFSDHQTVYAGWMSREHPNSNEIYEPSTVDQKLDLTAQSRVNIPCLFDLKEKKVISVDLNVNAQNNYGGNNIESNMASVADSIKTIIDSNNKISLYELFSLHAKARGEIVKNKENADFTFGLNRENDISIYDLIDINSEYIY